MNHSTGTEGRPDQWSLYACTQRPESGRETVYNFSSDTQCQVSVRLSELSADIDLVVIEGCDPSAHSQCSSTPLDIQTQETIAFQSDARRDYAVVVDGYSEASGSHALSVDCQCGASGVDLSDGQWLLQVDRRWNGDLAGVQSPSTPLAEEDYESVTDGPVYTTRVLDGWQSVSIGDEPWLGQLSASPNGELTYDLSSGTFAGGRLVVWVGSSGLQAELTLYGSGVPITSSERGALVRTP